MDSTDTGAEEVRRILGEAEERSIGLETRLQALLGTVEPGSRGDRYRSIAIVAFAVDWVSMPSVSDSADAQRLRRGIAATVEQLDRTCVERAVACAAAKTDEERARLAEESLVLRGDPVILSFIFRAAAAGLMHATLCSQHVIDGAIEKFVDAGALPEHARSAKGRTL